MSRIPPAHPGLPPSLPHCTCMSGITREQLEMLRLKAVFQFAAWFVFEAESAVSGPAPIGNPDAVEWLVKIRENLTRWEHQAHTRAFPQEAP